MNAFPNDAGGASWYVRAVTRHVLLVAAVVVLAVLTARAYSDRQEPRYDAAADLLLSPLPSGDSTFLGIDVIRETIDGDAVVTAARFVTSAPVVERAALRVGRAETRTELLDRVEVEPRSPSNTVTIVGRDRSPEGAAAIANAFADAVIAERRAQFQADLRRVVRRTAARLRALPVDARESTQQGRALQDRLANLNPFVGEPDPTIRISARAAPPEEPAWPRPRLAMVVAGLVGLLFGITAAIAYELVNPYVRREEDLTREYGFPVIGRVSPLGPRSVRDHLTGRRSLRQRSLDAYRTLRAALVASHPDGRMPETIAVTAPRGDAERASVALALASTIALSGQRVLLVDADFREGHLSSAIEDRPAHGGLGRLLAGIGDLDDVLVRDVPGHDGRLGVLVSTEDDRDLTDYFDAQSIAAAVEKMREHADVVVFATASLAEAPEAFAVARSAETVLVAVRLGQVRRKRLRELRDTLAALRISPAGVVVVRRRRRLLDRTSPGDEKPRSPHPRPGAPRRPAAREDARRHSEERGRVA